MKNPLFTGLAFAFTCAATAAISAQTMPQSSANDTMTLIGCVGGGASATDPYMLSNATLGKVGTATPGQPTATMGTTAGATTAGSPTPMPTTVSPATPPTAATAGTAAGTTGVTGSTSATSSSSGAVGTTGTATAAAMSGYRLSGYDVSGFNGQRVQITGSLVQPTASATAPATGAREFHVQSVLPMSGACPPK